MEKNRLFTGIGGFDRLIPEGIPRESHILISGKAGTGKSIFALEFIYQGFNTYKEPGIYVSFEQNKNILFQQAKNFGWDLEKHAKAKKLSILSFSIDEIDRDFLNIIVEKIKRLRASRLVIDSLPFLALSPVFSSNSKFNLLHRDKVKFAYNAKQFIYNLIHILKESNITALYISSSNTDDYSTIDETSEYICDGIIHLQNRSMGKAFIRTLEIQKMRRAEVLGGLHKFDITQTGIKVEEET